MNYYSGISVFEDTQEQITWVILVELNKQNGTKNCV